MLQVSKVLRWLNRYLQWTSNTNLQLVDPVSHVVSLALDLLDYVPCRRSAEAL